MKIYVHMSRKRKRNKFHEISLDRKWILQLSAFFYVMLFNNTLTMNISRLCGVISKSNIMFIYDYISWFLYFI